jgi:cell division protein FtsB
MPRKSFHKYSFGLWIGLGAVIFILAVVFVPGDHGILQYIKLKQQEKYLSRRIDQLKKDQEALQEEKEKLENDLSYIEKLAREKYRMAAKGEKVFKVIQIPKDIQKKRQ